MTKAGRLHRVWFRKARSMLKSWDPNFKLTIEVYMASKELPDTFKASAVSEAPRP